MLGADEQGLAGVVVELVDGGAGLSPLGLGGGSGDAGEGVFTARVGGLDVSALEAGALLADAVDEARDALRDGLVGGGLGAVEVLEEGLVDDLLREGVEGAPEATRGELDEVGVLRGGEGAGVDGVHGGSSVGGRGAPRGGLFGRWSRGL